MLKNKLTRILSLILILALSVTMFTGCGGKEAAQETSEEVTINFLVSDVPTVQALKELLPEFKEQTGITVNMEIVSYDSMIEKTTLDTRSNTAAYDVFWVEGTHMGRLAGNNEILPLNELVADSDVNIEDFPAAVRDVFTYDGKLYALPYEGCLMVVAYRKDLFDANGIKPAATWDEYEKIAQQLNGIGVSGTSLMGKRHESSFFEWLNMLWGFGGSLFDEDGNPAVGSPEAVASLEYFKKLTAYAPEGTLSYTWTESATDFQQGKVAQCVVFSDWTGAFLDKTASKVIDKWAYAPIPGGEARKGAFGGYGWAINADSEQQEAAYEFIKWATSADVQKKLVKVGLTPTRVSVLEDKELAEDPNLFYLPTLEEAYQYTQVPTQLPQYFELMDTATQYISEALTGQKDAAAAAAEMQKEWEKIMAKAE